MDAKITLSFDEAVIHKAKKFAEANHISLSRLTELLYRKITTENYKSIEDFPISNWVAEVAQGPAEYKKKHSGRKATRDEFFKSRK
jgi:hypothetical protein